MRPLETGVAVLSSRQAHRNPKGTMATFDNRYSRFVAWFKVLLPLAALILLSTMFLISRGIDPTRALTYAKVDLDNLARTQRITGPQFSGVTEDGSAMSFSAKSAQPDAKDPSLFTVDELRAELSLPDGGDIRISAGGAVIDGTRELLGLSGGVRLETSTDYQVTTPSMSVSTRQTWAESNGPVVADGPAGRIEAGKVELSRQGDDSGTYLLVFKGGVKMVYTPKPAENE